MTIRIDIMHKRLQCNEIDKIKERSGIMSGNCIGYTFSLTGWYGPRWNVCLLIRFVDTVVQVSLHFIQTLVVGPDVIAQRNETLQHMRAVVSESDVSFSTV